MDALWNGLRVAYRIVGDEMGLTVAVLLAFALTTVMELQSLLRSGARRAKPD